MSKPIVEVGQNSKWRASVTKCGTRFGGDHHVYIDFVDDSGSDIRNSLGSDCVRVGDFQYWPEKEFPEPAINLPLWKGEVVSVSMSDASDTVHNLRTDQPEAGEDFGHISYHIVFVRVGEPAPGAGGAAKSAIVALLEQVIALVKEM